MLWFERKCSSKLPVVIQREAFSLPFYCAGFAHREWMQVEYIMFFISCLLQMYKKEKMQENFCLTFSKKKNIILVNE